MTNGKKDILIIMGRYLPGYKDGGPVRSIQNLVDYLGEEYNFRILTCDRDHGDTQAYPNIKVNDWNHIGNAQVYYVPPKGFGYKIIRTLTNQADLVYVCGCFNDYAINTLLLKRLGMIKKPVVVAAMGLFSPMEFKLKYRKKKLFTTIFNLTGMFKNIYWSATTQMEVQEINQQIKIRNNYFIAEDLPRKVDNEIIIKPKEVGKLKVVWISRIAPKKNLLGAIKILQHVKSQIEFTIYGPVHVPEYWNMCLEELNKLPANIEWRYEGDVESELVVASLKKHHVFLFPTLGENYGHVIQEALSAGCAAVISDQTPWECFEENGFGHIFSVNEVTKFIEVIENYAEMEQMQYQIVSFKAFNYVKDKSIKASNNTGYRKIFNVFH
ncbi:glycosyltransferase family 4 protein [Paenibacillus protaetiae]|uniref:Glycosyltransferase n=1 Tax=Paenibacillus protaetiae TaxID=2509456 RepID=A0A4P6EVS7_9BACL|nr:glycosyltransferase family 4 protein [Paenibacillus protaetiae]QAY66766.1 glycosyltransferase [Paenibacillus protaetiae]